MSRQIKLLKKAKSAKAAKGNNSKASHWAENQARPKFPHEQPAPHWVRPTGGKKGKTWLNKKGSGPKE